MEFRGTNEEYLLLAEVTQSSCYLLKERIINSLSLLWISADNTRLMVDNKAYIFQKNDVVCLTEFHHVENVEIAAVRLVRFNRQFFCVTEHDSEVGCRGVLFFGAKDLPYFSIPESELEKFDILWRMFRIEMQSQDGLQIEMLQMMLKRLLILSTRLYNTQKLENHIDSPQHDLFRSFNFLVETHFREKHTVAEYAELLYRSPKTISNLFTKLGDRTPLQIIQERRMLEARRMLRYTDLPVGEVAFALNFEDVQTFSRFFKGQEGLSPTDFRMKK